MDPCEIQDWTTRYTLSIRFRAAVQDSPQPLGNSGAKDRYYPARQAAVQPLPQRLGNAYRAIGEYLNQLGEAPAGGVFAAYYNMDMQDLDVEAGFTVAKRLPGSGEIQASEIPAGTFAVCHFTGPYAAMAPGYEALTQFARDNGYKPSGIAYEWYFSPPDTPPQDIKTDIVFPVTRIGERVIP
ncbi:MAG: GyrI-like domain-containing protein [Anaerolineae bacterium]|nr:GyrI-like domain-containing protein [Anaerolineae bacterium]